MIDIPVFIICLLSARAPVCNQTLTDMHTLFKNVTIQSAVEGSRIRLDDSRISPYAKYHINHNLDLDLAHVSSMGAIGCYLSHVQLWKKAVEKNTSIIVMEDDIPVDSVFLRKVIQEIPENVDHAGLIYFPWVGPAKCNKVWCNPISRDSVFGTQMYYITAKGASILLKHAFPIIAPVDIYISYVANTNTDFKSVFYKSSFFPFYQPLMQEIHSTIGRHLSIKKILMPESNMYYIIFILIFALVYLCPKKYRRCTCKIYKAQNKKSKDKKISEYHKLVNV